MESKKAEREKKRAYLATIRNNRPTQTHKRTRVQDDMELNVSNDLIDPYESENENNDGEFNLNQVEFDRPPVQIIYASRTVWSFYSSIHSYRNLCMKSKKPLMLISSVWLLGLERICVLTRMLSSFETLFRLMINA